MSEERAKRKLSAILSADVKGYSRLMQDDESLTIQTLKAYRELMTSLVQEYRGRVVDSPGDNVLSEFGSVVDAVECAVKIQRELKEKNEELPENRRMVFRIGINLGDVIEEEGKIYGDGVNVAARIESLAEAGGISISGTVYDHVKNKLPFKSEYQGEQSVKNISEPVRIYHVSMVPEAADKGIAQKWPRIIPLRWKTLSAGVMIILTAGILAIWNFYFKPPPLEPASVERMAFKLPDKHSIAVLPFINMSGDPEQEYFSDGITEDLRTDLSKISGFFIIARNSTFAYKRKPVTNKCVII